MQPTIQHISEKKLIGKHITMTLADNKTGLLWKDFMPRRNEIPNRVSGEFISMQVYGDVSPASPAFGLQTPHEKWAAVEVHHFDNVPGDMETFIIPAGLYAVFPYRGTPQEAGPFFRALFGTWLPASEYTVDDRPHFEILGEKYKNNDPASEEEVWVPVRLK